MAHAVETQWLIDELDELTTEIKEISEAEGRLDDGELGPIVSFDINEVED